jgi:thiamine-phosphate pyrophosphorylase
LVELCLVTDPALGDALVPTVLAAVRGGVTLVQLRDKTASDDELVTAARALLAVLRPRRIPLLVNDRVEVARRAGADGVHLGQHDESPASARRKLGPRRTIGLSITSLAERARADADGIADYYGVGPYFATATKSDHDPPLGLAGARAIVAGATRPCFAIGGIDARRAPAVLATGVVGLAVVSAICGQPDPERAARALLPSTPLAISEVHR